MTIKLDCYTYYPKVYEKHKLKTKEFPKWAKEETKKLNYFKDIYESNITVPLWSDMTFIVDSKGDIEYELTSDDKYTHVIENIVSNEKYDELMFSNVVLLNLKSPWLIKSDKDVKFHYTTLLWNHIKSVDKFWFLNKVFSFNKFTEIDLTFMITMSPRRQGIEEGTDVMQLVPMSEEQVEINHLLITEKEYEKLKSNK
jgi:hypothetical protein